MSMLMLLKRFENPGSVMRARSGRCEAVVRSAIVVLVFCLSAGAWNSRALGANGVLGPDHIATGDFETGDLSQWRPGIHAADPARQVQIVTAPFPVRQGTYAVRFEVEDGDQYGDTAGERAEVSTLVELYPRGGPNHSDGAGDEYYYAWSTYFPKDNFPAIKNWMPSFMNWHASHAPGTASLSFGVDPGPMNIRVMVEGGLCSMTSQCVAENRHYYPILTGVKQDIWNDFVVHAKWEPDNTGLIEVWHKYEDEDVFEKVLSLHGIPTLVTNSTTGEVLELYKKQGFYRSASETETAVVYQDAFTQGYTFEAVTNHAFHYGEAGQVPEPTTLALLGAGGLMLLSRRRRKAQA